MKNKKTITVLDYETSRVYQYKVKVNIHSLEFITFKGHNIANVEWMEHQIGNVITN